MILETERLILESWRRSDWVEFRPIATDVEVMRYITGGVPWTDQQVRSFVDRQIQLYVERGYCRWKLINKSAGNMVGFCGVGFFHGGSEPEIGWWLARRCWGSGLATEAARVALRDAFERVGLERITSVAMLGNTASMRIMEKLGLELEFEFEHDGVRLVRYAIERARYIGGRAG